MTKYAPREKTDEGVYFIERAIIPAEFTEMNFTSHR